MLSINSMQDYSLSNGLELLGIIDGSDLFSARKALQKRLNRGYRTPWESIDLQARTSPNVILPGCKSIILLALPYQAPSHPEVPLLDTGPRGKVARIAHGIDYHPLLEAKAYQMVKFIKKETGASFSFRVQVDKTSLLERGLAKKAGAMTGLNSTVITLRYGSWVALGEILLDLELPPFHSHFSGCHECGKCRDYCPTGAITQDNFLNPHKCISYLTQSKNLIPRHLRPVIGNLLYGCDICQEVCPHNQNVPFSPLNELSHLFFPSEPALFSVLSMSKKEFSLTVGLTSASWIGRQTLLRNAIINLGNSREKLAAEPLSQIFKHHTRPGIRAQAAWSLGQLEGPYSRYTLESALTQERSAMVKEEIKYALYLS